MRNFLFFFIFLLIYYPTGTFSQSDVSGRCPNISVNGPADIVGSDRPAVFAAIVGDGAKMSDLKYWWTLNDGRIIEGQGTLTISAMRGSSGSNLTATLEISGLPKSCPNAASVTLPSGRDIPLARSMGNFSSWDDPRFSPAIAAKIIKETKNEPNSQLYILAIFANGFSKSKQKQQIARFRTRLMGKNGLSSDRMTFATSFANFHHFKVYLVPPGADNPQP